MIIGFHCNLNGETKISYTRYNSHILPVCGVLLVDDVISSSGNFGDGYDEPDSSPL